MGHKTFKSTPSPHSGLDTVRRTLKMAARFKKALDSGENINGVDLQIEFELSQATVKRFIKLYKEEFDESFKFDFKKKSYQRIEEV